MEWSSFTLQRLFHISGGIVWRTVWSSFLCTGTALTRCWICEDHTACIWHFCECFWKTRLHSRGGAWRFRSASKKEPLLSAHTPWSQGAPPSATPVLWNSPRRGAGWASQSESCWNGRKQLLWRARYPATALCLVCVLNFSSRRIGRHHLHMYQVCLWSIDVYFFIKVSFCKYVRNLRL